MAKPTHKKKPKDQRKSRRGWAEGKREEVLTQYLSRFTQAISGSKPQSAADEVLRVVYARFFYHFPWDKPDDWEPETIDDFDPDVVMEPEILSEEMQEEKSRVMKEKKSAIQRWLRHRAAKVRQMASDLRADRLSDPYQALLAKLSGIVKPKKARQAYQEWQSSTRSSDPRTPEPGTEPKPNSHYIDKAARRRWKNEAGHSKAPHQIPGFFRQKIARELFNELPADVRDSYKKDAEDAAKKRRAEWDDLLSNQVLEDPIARDSALYNLNDFLTPILAGIESVTGCMAVMSVVGPMGSNGGDISAMIFAHNVNQEAVPKTLFEWMPRRVDAWRDHLKQYGYTYFSTTDMQNAKLPSGVKSVFEGDSPQHSTTNTDAMIIEMLSQDVGPMPDKDVLDKRLNSDNEDDDDVVMEDNLTHAKKAPAMPAAGASGSVTNSTTTTRKRLRSLSQTSSPGRDRPRTRQRRESPSRNATVSPPSASLSSPAKAQARPKPRPLRRVCTEGNDDGSPPPRRYARRSAIMSDEEGQEEPQAPEEPNGPPVSNNNRPSPSPASALAAHSTPTPAAPTAEPQDQQATSALSSGAEPQDHQDTSAPSSGAGPQDQQDSSAPSS
ncbi:hypothetical protein CYLTODRAFT_492474, partial [Cylindrobasidium torrendii FP15055 ss-10]